MIITSKETGRVAITLDHLNHIARQLPVPSVGTHPDLLIQAVNEYKVERDAKGFIKVPEAVHVYPLRFLKRAYQTGNRGPLATQFRWVFQGEVIIGDIYE